MQHVVLLRRTGIVQGFYPMTGHRSFHELTDGFSPARKARVAARVTQLNAGMLLHERPRSSVRSQEDLAPEQDVDQSAVTKR
jgi:hypothetical protein